MSNSNGDSLVGKVLCPTLHHRLSLITSTPNRCDSLRNSISTVGRIRFISRGPVNGDAHDGPTACLGTCSTVHALFTGRPLTGRVKFAPRFFSFGARNKEYRRYGKTKCMAVRVRFVTSLALAYRTYGNGQFGRSVLRMRCKKGGVGSILGVAIGRTVRFFDSRELRRRINSFSTYHVVIDGLGPLRRIKLNCVGLNRGSDALSNNRGRHIGLTCFVNGRSRSPALFVFSRPAANLRFRSVGHLLRTFRTLVRHNRSLMIVRRGLSIVGYTSRVVSLKPRNNSGNNGLIVTNAPRRITTYGADLANGFLGGCVGWYGGMTLWWALCMLLRPVDVWLVCGGMRRWMGLVGGKCGSRGGRVNFSSTHDCNDGDLDSNEGRI